MARGEGTTTKQMEAAPKGAVFVWCNRHTDYAIHLARKIGREDLRIVSPTWLEHGCWKGLDLTGLVVDHAARLTDMQWDNYQSALTRVRSTVELRGAPPIGGASLSNAGFGVAGPEKGEER